MKFNFSVSEKIFFALVAVLALCSAVAVFLPLGDFANLASSKSKLPAPLPVLALVEALVVLVVYGGLGYLGLKLSRRIGFARLWDERISNRQRFLIPFMWGIGAAILIIIGDVIFSRFNGIGYFPHPPFPTSLVAAIGAGIGEELLFRLFFISFWVWLISYVFLKNKYHNQVFWVVATFSAIVFALGHLPSLMIILGVTTMAAFPPVLLAEILILNSFVSFPAAYYLKKYGFLAAVGIHLWCDIAWHAVYGFLK